MGEVPATSRFVILPEGRVHYGEPLPLTARERPRGRLDLDRRHAGCSASREPAVTSSRCEIGDGHGLELPGAVYPVALASPTTIVTAAPI